MWILFIILSIIFIWLIIVPIVYSLYRFFVGTKYICPSCKAQNSMVSVNSPIGRELYEKYYKK
ncbi:MAG: hypothetical protein K5622_01535 [Endomicrobiaceae bacterium]|nr:hypothetical protein [Endomicrobiaceae bacterium]